MSGIGRLIFLVRGLIIMAVASTLIVACRHGTATSTGAVSHQRTVPAARPVADLVVPPDLLDTSWRLVRIDGRELDPELPDITLTFEPDRLNGSGGCNWYTGWLAEAQGGLTISHLAVTRRDCLHPRLMDREARYLVTLEEVSGYELADGGLVLTSRNTETGRLTERLVFEPSDNS